MDQRLEPAPAGILLGLYTGLGQLGSDADRERVLVEMFRETMFAKAGGDLFGTSALGVKLRAFREQLLRSWNSSTEKQSAIDDGDAKSIRDLALCIEHLDGRWRFHRDLARRELRDLQSGTVRPEQALKVLGVLDSSFRELFLTLTEGPRHSESS